MDEAASDPAPTRRTEIADSQGVQSGDGNVQVNVVLGGGQLGQGQPTGPVVAGEIPQEPVAFQPREELLSALRSGGPGVAVVTAVTGMRGVGKTQVAAAFARECVNARWRLVGWVDAQETATLLSGMSVVAARLGIAPGAGAEDAAGAVRNWLETDGKSCLLVFDNATDPDVLRRFVPAMGRARVVVTSAGPLPGIRGAVLPVNVFSEAQGLAFLAKRTGLADEAGARAVGEELGWLPLGLAQAGAVIAAQRLSYGVYLERLRQVPVSEYLSAGPGDPYPQGVAEAVLLSLDAVASTEGGTGGGACRAALELVSVLSPAGVPRSLLHAAAESGSLPGCGGTRGVDQAVGRLAAGSLLTFSGDGGSVAAHRLVMRVVRERAQHEDALVSLGMKACCLLRTVMESLGEPWKNRSAARDLIGQVMALHQNLSPCLDSSPELAVVLLELRSDTLDELLQLGDAVGLAVTIGRSVAADCERLLGKDDPNVPRCQNNLALAYRKAGRLDEAIPLYETVLVEYKRTLGAIHSTTLMCQNNLATAYRAAGRPEDAIPLLEATLTSYEQTPDATRLNTLTFRNNLATAYQEAERLGDATPLLEATATDCERALGATHPSTLMCKNNLASAWLAAGRPDNAIPLLEATLIDSKRILSATHPSTLMCKNNLATAYRAAGYIDKALPLFETTLTDSERVLGTAHPQTLMARKNLISTYEELWLFAVWGDPEDGADEDNAGGPA